MSVKITLAGLALVLTGCAPDYPCMAPTESGTVVAVKGNEGEFCGRGGCYRWSSTTVTLRMPNGVDRVCLVSKAEASMFTLGQRLSLPRTERVM